MIFCCGSYFSADETCILQPVYPYKDRILEILEECPSKNEQCGAYIAELTQTNILTNKRTVKRKKNSAARRFVRKCLNELDYIYSAGKYGTKSNMNWKYGQAKEIKDKNGNVIEIIQKSVDFNNAKSVVKQIYLPLNDAAALPCVKPLS